MVAPIDPNSISRWRVFMGLFYLVNVHQLVRVCHLGPLTMKMHFWVHKLVESFTAGP
jgi:hypothetical protein